MKASIPKFGVTNPNFEKVSKAYKINFNKIKDNKSINRILKKTIKSNKTEFIELC